jgi:hypothetical protein
MIRRLLVRDLKPRLLIVIYLAWQKHLFGLRGGVATETETS